jgi:Na+/H+ antiporter NhaD/arsenite permease-like protein
MSVALILICVVFVLGYMAIATEHNIHIDKTASAILTGVLCWTLYIVNAQTLVDLGSLPAWFQEDNIGKTSAEIVNSWVGHHQLLGFLGEISSILFFLLGAMTLVELVDSYGGFQLITRHIRSKSTVTLLWVIGFIAFFLSAALDNLTTTIVMISLIRKLINDAADRWFFAGIIVVAANAGGAWSPIGDVTTTMLWIGGQITTLNIIEKVFLPSVACLAVPLLYLSWKLKGKTIQAPVAKELSRREGETDDPNVTPRQRLIIFCAGIGGLLFVPVFKTLTHLPPFMGILLSLSVVWIISELMHEDRDQAMDSGLHIVKVLKRVDTPSVLFFLGILIAVAALEATGILHSVASALDSQVGNINIIVFLIGLLSAIVDNVPLVAASMGMYDLATYPTDSPMWEYLAFAAGTGGSCLIIGSAAGVAAMGMERINFFWYLKNIGGLALLGYVAGSAVYFLI